MFLHNDNDAFLDVIERVTDISGLAPDIVEKDYYVSIILKELALRCPNAVFKGGTSLSKAYHAIDRFSEDIDITFEEHIGNKRRKKLKYNVLKPTGETLGLEITNWEETESKRNYNHYDFSYRSVLPTAEEKLIPYVKLETALMSYAFPTVKMEIGNYICDYLKEEEPEIIKDFGLSPFTMKVQTLERTLCDKIFAVCDYYLQFKPQRNSRHLYDIYKLGGLVDFNESFKALCLDVRKHRAAMDRQITPSARNYILLPMVADEIVSSGFYKEDYEKVTSNLTSDAVEYADAAEFFQKTVHRLFD